MFHTFVTTTVCTTQHVQQCAQRYGRAAVRRVGSSATAETCLLHYTTVYRGINSLTLTYTTRDSCITYN